MREDITIRPETPKDYKDIVSMVLRSFQEGTDYSDGTDIVALIEEIRMSKYYIPTLSFVAERSGQIVGHFMFSRFPLSKTADGGHGKADEIVMLAPVSVHADFLHQHIGVTMLTLGIEKVRKAGFKGITVESVAHGIGLAKSSIYDMYENKTQMIGSLIQEEFESLYQVIEKNISHAESNAERGYVIMETALLYYMKKPEVLTVCQWFQIHSVNEIIHDKGYEQQIFSRYFENIELYDKFPDLGLPIEDKRIIASWFMMIPVVLFMHTRKQKISPEVVQAMLKDILIMMEKGVGNRK